MEEIKVGEYARTIGGYIYKAKKIYENRIWVSNNEFILPGMITKHSSNIIDLVEVGDYVNGKLVKHIADFEGVKEPIRKLIFVDEHRLVPGETAKNDEIKSICTREQFENTEYKLDN